MPFFGFFDPTFLLVIPFLIFALWAQSRVQGTYQKYARVRAANGLTGRQMAEAIMRRNGVDDVKIEEVGGVLSDHYDPRTKTVRLSAGNYEDASLASIAVAAHEVGHVLQHKSGYVPLGLRASIAPVAGFGSTLAFPLFFIGLVFFHGARTVVGQYMLDAGILLFAGAVVFHLITLPVEFDASRRALVQLNDTGALAPQEIDGARKVLNAAALTYVAAAAMAAVQLLRLILLSRSSRR
jgi:uncharacterized protein